MENYQKELNLLQGYIEFYQHFYFVACIIGLGVQIDSFIRRDSSIKLFNYKLRGIQEEIYVLHFSSDCDFFGFFI